jgi:hypothetical protein
MTKEYREDLAAAHARIAQLEARLAEADETRDPKIKALEERRALIARTSEPKYLRKLTAGIIGGFTFVLTLIGVIAWAAAGAIPSEAGMILGIGGMGLFLGLLIGLLQLFLTPVTATRQIEVIDQQIAEARRIAKLESEVAEMRRVRVASEPSAASEEDEELAEDRHEASPRKG